jgi:hypothetical protein
MPPIHPVMKEPIIHLQAVSVIPGGPLTPFFSFNPILKTLHPDRVVMIISDGSVECLLLQAVFLVPELRTHNLESIETLVLEVESEPHRREVAPAHLLQDDVPVVQDLPK